MLTRAYLLAIGALSQLGLGCLPESKLDLVALDGGRRELSGFVFEGARDASQPHFQTLQVGTLLLSSDGQLVVAVDTSKHSVEVLQLSAHGPRVLQSRLALPAVPPTLVPGAPLFGPSGANVTPLVR